MDRVESPCGRSTRKSAMSWARSSKETSDELRRMWIDPRRMRTLQSEIREQGPFRLYRGRRDRLPISLLCSGLR